MARNQVAKKVYIASDGTETRSPDEKTKSLEFRFVGGDTRSLTVSGFPANIQALFAWNGMAQKVGDAYANSDSVDEAIETYEGVTERLMSGDWTADREGGVIHTAVLLEAAKRTREGAGLAFDPESTKAKLVGAGSKEYRAKLNTIPEFIVHQKDILAERATARANEARAKLKGSATDVLASI